MLTNGDLLLQSGTVHLSLVANLEGTRCDSGDSTLLTGEDCEAVAWIAWAGVEAALVWLAFLLLATGKTRSFCVSSFFGLYMTGTP